MITVEEILKKEPCKDWNEDKIRKFIGDGKTLLEILGIEDVSASDRIWCVIQFLPDVINREFAIWCARQCETNMPEINNYIDTIEKFYAGKATNEELKAANKAADKAAYWAAYKAAYKAANDAAYWAACWAVKDAAYWAADKAAYWAANKAADWAVNDAVGKEEKMRKSQLEKLKQLVKGGEQK